MPLEYSEVLRDGFWPMSRVRPSFEDQFMEAGDVREEYDEDEHFDRQAQDRPLESFQVNQDLHEGHFVAICPFEEDRQPHVWIARALSNSNSNPKHLGYMPIPYF